MPGPCVVLLVDDNAGDSVLLRHALELVGFDGAVVAVESGRQAFAYLRGEPPYASLPRPHLIMLDLNMPQMTGFEVLRELKAARAWSAIPVMIFSSSTRPSEIAQAHQLGAKRFITKPLEWDGFLSIARDVKEACCEAA